MRYFALLFLILAAAAFGRSGQIDLLNRTTAVFDRESTAYLDGVEYAADVKRTERRLVPSEVILTIPTAEPVSGVGNLRMGYTCNINGTYYATLYNTGGGLYSSPDGVTWTQILEAGSGSSQTGGITKIFGSSAGTVFVTRGSYLFRATDPATLTNTYTANTANAVLALSASAYIEKWNWHQNSIGTIVVGQYLTAGTDLFLWRSTNDGATWTKVYTNPAAKDTAKGNGMRHSHRVYYHEATATWLAVWGDGSGTNMTTASTDDGVTWTDYFAQGDGHFQPVEFYDYGDATKLLCGSDGPGCLKILDVATKARSNLFTDTLNTLGATTYDQHCFAITKYGNTVYFGVQEGPENVVANGRKAAIYATNDLINFYPVVRFHKNETGVLAFLGVKNGRMHMVATDSDNMQCHAYYTLPTITTKTGLALDPATTNIVSSANASSVETSLDARWQTAPAGKSMTVARSDGDALHGTYSALYSGTLARETYVSPLYAHSVAPVAGTKYSMQVSGKGIDYIPFLLRALSWGGTVPTRPLLYNCLSTEWQTFFAPPYTAQASIAALQYYFTPSGSTAQVTYDTGTDYCTFTTTAGHILTDGDTVILSAVTTMPTHTSSTPLVAGTEYYVRDYNETGATGRFKLSLTSGGAALDIDGAGTGNQYVTRSTATGWPNGFYLDCIQIEAGPPTRWQIAGTARAYESLTNTLAFDEVWTNKFTISPYPPFYAFDNGFGAQHIKSWWHDANNYIEVYWNSTDYKLYVSVVNGGAAAVTYASVNLYRFFPNAILHAALIYDGSLLSLHLSDAGRSEIITCTSTYAWMRRIAGTKTGNYAGNAVMSMTLLEDYYYPNRISLMSDLQVSDTYTTAIDTKRTFAPGSGTITLGGE